MSVESMEQIVPRSRQELTLERVVRVLIYVLAVTTILWHLYFAYSRGMPTKQHANIHLGLLLAIFYFTELDFEPETWRHHVGNVTSVLFLVGAVASTIYVHTNFIRWLTEARPTLIYTQTDLIVGVAIILLVIHATVRAYGWILGAVIIFSLLYALYGSFLPGVLGHSGIEPERLIFMNSVALNGVYGFILVVCSTWVAIFIFFAGIIESYGGMEYVLETGKHVGSRFKSGSIQVAVFGSMLVGSIMGSSAANVATTGSFTIPLMKDDGVPAKYAGAIESIASTAGQILPPVMGTAAFIMADILGISFYEVIRGAILPAFLFYTSFAFIAHFEAMKHGWNVGEGAVSEDLAATDKRTWADRARFVSHEIVQTLPYTIPLGVLIYTLVILRFNPFSSGMYAISAIVISAFIRDLVIGEASTRTVKIFIRRFIEGCKIGSVNMAPLTAVCAALGIVVRVLTFTGFTQRFSIQMISIAGGVFFLVVLLAMFASILFGMGMPTTAAYIVVAILTAPGLVRLGFGELASHMFVFYYALLSTITPPVALSCAVAAGLSGASFWDTAIATMRMGIFAFTIPLVFLFNPELIYWNGTQTWITFLTSVVGMWGLGIVATKYNLNNTIGYLPRLGYLVVAGIILFANSQAVKVGLAAVLVGWMVYRLMGVEGIEKAITKV